MVVPFSLSPDRDTTRSSVDDSALDVGDYRSRLVATYTLLEMPEKVKGVDAVLRKYEGREKALFAALQRKYGEELQRRRNSPKATPGESRWPQEASKEGDTSIASPATAISKVSSSFDENDMTLEDMEDFVQSSPADDRKDGSFDEPPPR
eukprot:g2445.t1